MADHCRARLHGRWRGPYLPDESSGPLMLDPARFRQPAHGFSKLTAVIAQSGGFRRCGANETPHAVVARVYDADTFAIVVSGEIDGLSGIQVGAQYGLDATGNLIVDGVGTVAIGCRETSIIVVQLTSQITSTHVDLTPYQLRSQKGAANGYAPLGPDSIIDSIYLPDTIDETARKRSWMGF